MNNIENIDTKKYGADNTKNRADKRKNKWGIIIATILISPILISATMNVAASSVTNLTNNSYADDHINWTWTDPYNNHEISIYLNGQYMVDVPIGVQYYNATNLTPNSKYTISVQTTNRRGISHTVIDTEWTSPSPIITTSTPIPVPTITTIPVPTITTIPVPTITTIPVPTATTGIFVIAKDSVTGKDLMAGVYLDGSSTSSGTTPLTLKTSAGYHSVIYKLTGYQDILSIINVISGNTIGVTRSMFGYTGLIWASTSPSGANIYLDNRPTNLGIVTYTMQGISIGEHDITYKLAGYNDCKISKSVYPDQTTDGSCGIMTTATASKYSISFMTKDSVTGASLSAKIYIDGVGTGYVTPYTMNVLNGPHYITYKLTGYNDFVKYVDVSSSVIDTTGEMSTVSTDTIRVCRGNEDSNGDCTVNVDIVNIETDYLPHVVEAENGWGPYESMKAQAVASRTYAYNGKAHPYGNFDVYGDIRSQVYDPSNVPNVNVINAVIETNGIILRWGNPKILTSGQFVAGSSSSGTSQFVTYNEGLSGDNITQSDIQWVQYPSSSNPPNRGCLGQYEANSLAINNGYTWKNILEYFYGADIIIEHI